MRPVFRNKIQTLKIILASCLLYFSIDARAQDEFSGQIEGWVPAVDAQVIAGMRVPYEIGKITADGSFSIPLESDFLEQTQKRMEAENQGDSKWTASLMSLEKAFSCMSGDLQMSGASQPMVKLSSFGGFSLANISEKKMYGAFMMVDSEAFAKAFLATGEFRTQPGYYLDWFFFEEAATVQGDCTIDSYAVNQKEVFEKTTRFNLDFKPGWNLVSYAVESVFTDQEGKTYPQVIQWETLEELPGDVKFLYLTN